MTSPVEQVRGNGREERRRSRASVDAVVDDVRRKSSARVDVTCDNEDAGDDDVNDEASDVFVPLRKRYSMMWVDNMRPTRSSIAHHFDDLERCGSDVSMFQRGRKSIGLRNGRTTLCPVEELNSYDDNGKITSLRCAQVSCLAEHSNKCLRSLCFMFGQP